MTDAASAGVVGVTHEGRGKPSRVATGFAGPLGHVQFDLPLGWGHDPWRSEAGLMQLVPWRGPAEAIAVQLISLPVTPEDTDEAWGRALQAATAAKDLKLLPGMHLGGRAVAVGSLSVPERDRRERLLCMRGRGLTALILHAEPLSASLEAREGTPVVLPVLRVIAESLVLPDEHGDRAAGAPGGGAAGNDLASLLEASAARAWSLAGDAARAGDSAAEQRHLRCAVEDLATLLGAPAACGRLSDDEALQQAMLATREALRDGRVMRPDGSAVPDTDPSWAAFAILGDARAVRYAPVSKPGAD